MDLQKGERIYYTGDMANNEGTGTIIRRYQDRWGDHIDIQMDDGREINQLPICAFSKEYKGHCGTRFVTLEAYNVFRRNRLELLGIIDAPDIKTINYNEIL